MLKQYFCFLILLISIPSIAQIETGVSLNGQINSVCINNINQNSDYFQSCDIDNIESVSLGISRISTQYSGFGLSYYAKHDFINIYDNLILGSGITLGANYNSFKKLIFSNSSFADQYYYTVSNLKSFNVTNNTFLYAKLMTWAYIEGGFYNSALLYRKFPKSLQELKNNKLEKKNRISHLYSKFYFSFGIEIKGVQLKFRYINISKNILVEYKYDWGKYRPPVSDDRAPIVTKFKGMSELILSIPIKQYKNKKLPYLKL